MKEFADSKGMTYPSIAADLGSRFERDGGIPTFVLMGPGHELLMVDEGHPTDADIQAAIDEYFTD
ncbi:MAG: TlpA family protein disulfide reductase [Myxococcota bacterium]